jgi:hypothetical protein
VRFHPRPPAFAQIRSPFRPRFRPTAPYVTSPRSDGPQALATLYRRRWRVQQAIEELLNGLGLDHLVGYRLHPNGVAISFRPLARDHRTMLPACPHV